MQNDGDLVEKYRLALQREGFAHDPAQMRAVELLQEILTAINSTTRKYTLFDRLQNLFLRENT